MLAYFYFFYDVESQRRMKNGFYYFDGGGPLKLILGPLKDEDERLGLYRFYKGLGRTYIGERVDSYPVIESLVLVARRPHSGYVDKDGMAQWSVSDKCEYILLDTENGDTIVSENPGDLVTKLVSCKPADLYRHVTPMDDIEQSGASGISPEDR